MVLLEKKNKNVGNKNILTSALRAYFKPCTEKISKTRG